MSQIKLMLVFVFFSFAPKVSLATTTYDLYGQFLQGKASSWRIEKISEQHFIPQPAGPTEEHVNTSIHWALDKQGQIIAGFRSFNTSTGCQSGCTPVIFHLKFDKDGRPQRVIQDPDHPLRKISHLPFSDEDLRRLNAMVVNGNPKLLQTDQPIHLTNNHDRFPPQTWTYYQDAVIAGGAYTTFVVFSAAINTRAYVSRAFKKPIWENNRNKFLDFLRKHKGCQEEILLCLKDSDRFLKPDFDLNPFDRTQIYSYIFHLFAQALHKNTANSETSLEAMRLFKQYPQILRSHANRTIIFLRQLAITPQGDKKIDAIFKHTDIAEWLSSNQRQFLPLLAHLLDKNAKLTSLVDEKKSAFLEFCSFDASVLEKAAIQLAHSSTTTTFALEFLAHLKIYFPEHKLNPFLINFEKNNSKRSKQIFEERKSYYIAQLLHEFTQEPLAFPLAKGYWQKNKKTVSIPEAKSKKRIYVFFAVWCGHCQEVISKMIVRNSKRLREVLQLVEVHSNNHNDYKNFAKTTGLDQAAFDVISLDDSNKNFYQEMSLFAVPKIIMTNQNNAIISFDLKIDFSSTTGERDLFWVMDHLGILP